MPDLAEVMRRHWPPYEKKYGSDMPASHKKAARAILSCRTAEAGMVFHQCGDCGKYESSPVSCGHRACNACGGHKAIEWEARQLARLLPVPYHMVTFTVPSEFREIFRKNQCLMYDIFFRESAAALSTLAADPKHLGGEIGMTGVLQTWTRDLRYHPHIHYLVPGGALTADGWVRPKNPDVLVPAKPLAAMMRNRFRDALKAADFKLYMTLPARFWKKPWNVDARRAGSGATAFGYLARYVQKTALDAARILAVTDETVTFRWTDRESGETRTQTVTGEEFLRRFLQHVLPKGFTRVRHFGFLSPAAKKKYERVRSLLRAGAIVLKLPAKPVVACPCCGAAMHFVAMIRPSRARPPPTPPKPATPSPRPAAA